MDTKNFLKITNKKFDSTPDTTTCCSIGCMFLFPVPVNSLNCFMKKTIHNELSKKNIELTSTGNCTFNVCARVSMKEQDVYDKETGEKLAYLKAKAKAVKKVKKTYKWLNEVFMPQYAEYIKSLSNHADALFSHVDEYAREKRMY